mgnify:CR=1 FL=1
MEYALTQFQRREQWREGQDRSRLLAAALESTQDGVIVTDMRGRIVSVNRAFTEITGYSDQEALGQNTDFLHSDRQPADFHEVIRNRVLRDGRWQGELWSQRKDGAYQALWNSVATVSNEQGLPTHLVTVFTDITAKKEVEAQLQELAHVDSLTGLPNRLMVLSRLEHALAAARRKHHKVAVLYIDLDNFKNVNDSLGHAVGDKAVSLPVRQLDHLAGAVEGCRAPADRNRKPRDQREPTPMRPRHPMHRCEEQRQRDRDTDRPAWRRRTPTA